MFACHCTSPNLPLNTCKVHQPIKRTHTVALGRYTPSRLETLTSEEKYEILNAGRCKDCNAKAGPRHICTRHPSEPEQSAVPY